MDPATDAAARDLVDAMLPLEVVIRPMFGGACFYLDGKVVGLVNHGAVFVKRSAADAVMEGLADLAPAYPGASLSWRLRPSVLDAGGDAVRDAVATVARALPAARPRTSRR